MDDGTAVHILGGSNREGEKSVHPLHDGSGAGDDIGKGLCLGHGLPQVKARQAPAADIDGWCEGRTGCAVRHQ